VKVRLWGAMSSPATPPPLLTRPVPLALVRRLPSPAAEIRGSRLLEGAVAPWLLGCPCNDMGASSASIFAIV
jgi:hypothetical protein